MIDRPVSMLGSVDSILFDNAPVAYSLLDLNGRQIGGNRAYWELFGYDPSEAGSIDVMRLTHPDDRELTRRYFADLLGGQVEETAIEKRYIRKDGSQFLGRLKAKAVIATAPADLCTALYVLLPVFRSGKMSTLALPPSRLNG